MTAPMARLRADFNRVVADRLASGAWGQEDVAMCNAAIQKALRDDDLELLGCWARWLQELASVIPVAQPDGIKLSETVVGPMRTDRKEGGR